MKYVLKVELQSDRIKGEFGINREVIGVNFQTSVQQVLNSLSLQQVKFFSCLEIEKSTQHEKKECFSINLSEEEISRKIISFIHM